MTLEQELILDGLFEKLDTEKLTPSEQQIINDNLLELL